jgi:UDP-galactose transporter B1
MSLKPKVNGKWYEIIFGAAGIYCSYVYFGLLQEKIFKTDYTGHQAEKFTYSFSVLLFQNLFAYLIAMLVNKYRKHPRNADESTRSTNTVILPLKTQWTLAGCTFGAGLFGNTALSFVSFPVQALMKSSKIMAILMVGLIFARGKVFTKYQYLSGIVITSGIVIFNLFGQTAKGDKETSIIGLLLLTLALFCDGMQSLKQDEAVKKYQPSEFDQMEAINKWSFLFSLLYALCTLQLSPFIQYCVKYPAVIQDLAVIAVLGTFGQLFIFYIVTKFNSWILGVVTTTRKFFTVLASILVYSHELNVYQWISVGLVFIGVAIEIFCKEKKALVPLPPVAKIPEKIQ